MKKLYKAILFLLVAFLFLGNAIGQTDDMLRVGHVDLGKLDYEGFSLNKDASIKISGTGARYDKWGNDLYFYGWILESKSRKVVWSMIDKYEDEYYEDRGIFNFDDEIQLRKGEYEVYYTAMFDYSSYYYKSESINSFVRSIVRAIVSDSDDEHNYRSNKLSMNVRGDEGVFSLNDGDNYLKSIRKKSIVCFARTDDDELLTKSFSLKEETEITIYTIGEKIKGKNYDYAWIYDLKTHEKVWPMESTKFAIAGGAKKNVFSVQKISLPKGDYQVNYVSDGTHSFYKWNSMPPNDPQFWGITIWTNKENRSNVEEVTNEYNPVIDIAKVGDEEYLSKGFELKKSMDIRVMCLGEIIGDRLCDYGWISSVNKHAPIWEFTDRRSDYAGGNSKNRMINEVVHFEKGKYVVYYVSDDSHSYRDWNANPPYDQNLWGITLWAQNDNDKEFIKLFDESEYQDENVLAEIVRVRDHEYLSRSFTLDKSTKIKVYAIGEGNDYGMDDTGWIKDINTRKIVWEMTYRNSDNAGGAKKNRVFDEYITLPKGEYKVYYETDGSHSYNDWNSSPPHNKEKYGITLYKE